MTDIPTTDSGARASYEIRSGEYAEELAPGEVAIWVPCYDGPPPPRLTSSTFSGLTQPFGTAMSGTRDEWVALARAAAMWAR